VLATEEGEEHEEDEEKKTRAWVLKVRVKLERWERKH
jgi:hypothetical protein